MGAPRRIDKTRKTGPATLAPGASAQVILSFTVPNDVTEGVCSSYGWECTPASGAGQVTFSIRLDKQHLVNDYDNVQSQQGTVPIPYTCRIPLMAGQLVEVIASNADPSNAYLVNARLTIEL